jgi:hypothetical protein
MKEREAIERMMQRSRYNASQLSVAMGRNRNFIGSTFAKGSIPRVDTLAKMADIMGYKVVLESDGDRIEIDPPSGE